MCIWWIIHHSPIICIYLFWKEASRDTLHVASNLFHESIYHWWLMHRRSCSEASILLSLRCNDLSIIRRSLI
jgi:hypothetical protein